MCFQLSLIVPSGSGATGAMCPPDDLLNRLPGDSRNLAVRSCFLPAPENRGARHHRRSSRLLRRACGRWPPLRRAPFAPAVSIPLACRRPRLVALQKPLSARYGGEDLRHQVTRSEAAASLQSCSSGSTRDASDAKIGASDRRCAAFQERGHSRAGLSPSALPGAATSLLGRPTPSVARKGVASSPGPLWSPRGCVCCR